MKLGVMPVSPSVLISPGYLSSELHSCIPSSQLSERLGVAQPQGGSKVGSQGLRTQASCSDLAQILARFLLYLESEIEAVS